MRELNDMIEEPAVSEIATQASTKIDLPAEHTPDVEGEAKMKRKVR